MSLQDIILKSLVIKHQGELASDTTGNMMNALFQNVADGLATQQQQMREQKMAEQKNKQSIEMFEKFGKTDSDAVGTLIPSLKMKEDGSFEMTAKSATPAEQKSRYDLGIEQGFVKDVQEGIDANTLRLRYPSKSSDIDQLQRAGTVRSGGIKDTVKIDGQMTDVTPDSTVEGEIISGGVKFVPKGYDDLGRVTGYERIDASESEKKRSLEVTELDASIKNLVNSFALANKEAKQVDNQGTRGIEGRIAGKIATIKGMVGDSPAVNVYRKRTKAFATTVAKAAGEVRPTDEDIRRFVATLMSTELSDEENQLLMEGLVADLRARGAKAVWAERVGGTSIQNQSTKPITVGRFIVEVE